MLLILRFYRLIAISLCFVKNSCLAFPMLFQGWKGTYKASLQSQVWGAEIARIMNLEVKVFGDLDLLKGGLIVSNHLGYLDIITHAAIFPLRFTPKIEIRRWPLLGWCLALNQPIWVDRSSRHASQKVMESIKETMHNNISLIVYPEGTSTSGKEGLLPFKSTPFEAVARGNFPIFPILTLYRDEPGRETVCWYGDMSLLPHVWDLLGYKSIQAEIHILEPIYPQGLSRKEIARKVHDIMEEEYARICNKRN